MTHRQLKYLLIIKFYRSTAEPLEYTEPSNSYSIYVNVEPVFQTEVCSLKDVGHVVPTQKKTVCCATVTAGGSILGRLNGLWGLLLNHLWMVTIRRVLAHPSAPS